MSSTLVEQYEQQARWRRWDRALALLPIKRGETVLDLGCGVGQIAARLAQLGAQVIGVDDNEELLAAARKAQPYLRFEKLDLNALSPAVFGPVDGMWASFVPAYFPDLPAALRRWRSCLRVGGWLALVEVDDLFAHDPLAAASAARLRAFYADSKRAGRHDFESGRTLADAARASGFDVMHEGLLEDDELCFNGAASPEVLAAWRARLERMVGLQKFMGEGFAELERDFLAALSSTEHRSRTRVFFIIARAQ